MTDGPEGTNPPPLERTHGVPEPLDRTVPTDHTLPTDRTAPTDAVAAGEVPVRQGMVRLDAPEPGVGDRVGVYRLAQQIGQGSFGTVWMAERVEGGFHQLVALKLTRASASSRAQMQRFQFERETLANLEHPGIARVFDGGETAGGALFYVMELVRGGRPITAFCDEKRLSIPERLRLFTQACEALAYAHKQGVVHRDLSPNNILAYEDESLPPGPGRMRVKLIDFGLAKPVTATAQHLAAADAVGTPIGTLAYASPEQIRGDPRGGTRSDVYALGAVLYELLVGTPPVDKGDLPTGKTRDELLRHISQSEPPPPSDRLSRMRSGGTMSPERLEALARARRVALDRLANELRVELNLLPMKALERLPDERYQSADELAADIRNYLELRPLRAHPRSATYVARKFVARHRGKVAVAGVVAVALVVSVVTIVFLYVEADRQRALALRRLDEQRRVAAFQRGMLSGLNAEREGQAWRSWLVQRLAQRMDSPDSTVAAGERARRLSEFESDTLLVNPTDAASAFLGQVVDGAVPGIETDFKSMPPVQADLLQAIVQIKLGLGMQSDPRLWPLQQRVLELRRLAAAERPADVFDALRWCAEVKRLQGGPQSNAESLAFAREALAGFESLDPAQPESVAECLMLMANLVPNDQAETLLRRIVDGSAFADSTRFRAAISLGMILTDAARFDEALRVLQGARTSYNSLKDDAPGAADLANNLAFALERQSSGLSPDRRAAGLAEAVGQYEQALALHGRVYGDDHSITIDTRNSLALALMKTGQAPARERAEALLQENLRRVRTNRPPEEVVQALNTLSKQVLEAGDIEQALRLSEQVMQGARGFYEPGREPILRTGKLRGEILRQAKRQPEAETLLRELLRDRLAWIAAHGQPAYDRLALDVASDLQGVLVEQGAFDRLPEVLATCDPIAAAGDDVKNEAKYLYLRQKAASLAAWAAQDPSKQASAGAAAKEAERVKALRQAAGQGV